MAGRYLTELDLWRMSLPKSLNPTEFEPGTVGPLTFTGAGTGLLEVAWPRGTYPAVAVKVTTAGDPGGALRAALSLDGGATFAASQLIPASGEVTTWGRELALTFSGTGFLFGDQWSCSTIASPELTQHIASTEDEADGYLPETLRLPLVGTLIGTGNWALALVPARPYQQLRLVNPGVNTASEAVSVSGDLISVVMRYAAGAISSTGATILAALLAAPVAMARLQSADLAPGSDGTGLAVAVAATALLYRGALKKHLAAICVESLMRLRGLDPKSTDWTIYRTGRKDAMEWMKGVATGQIVPTGLQETPPAQSFTDAATTLERFDPTFALPL